MILFALGGQSFRHCLLWERFIFLTFRVRLFICKCDCCLYIVTCAALFLISSLFCDVLHIFSHSYNFHFTMPLFISRISHYPVVLWKLSLVAYSLTCILRGRRINNGHWYVSNTLLLPLWASFLKLFFFNRLMCSRHVTQYMCKSFSMADNKPWTEWIFFTLFLCFPPKYCIWLIHL